MDISSTVATAQTAEFAALPREEEQKAKTPPREQESTVYGPDDVPALNYGGGSAAPASTSPT